MSLWSPLLWSVLRLMPEGDLTVALPDGGERRFAGSEPGPSARVDVRDLSATRRIITGGGIGLAETYMDGAWDTLDLLAVLDLGMSNMARMPQLPAALRVGDRLWHARRDNDDRGGSKRNIAHHYDLGNDFYELWLDETMAYSAACPDDDGAALDDEGLACAQRRKWDRILELLQPGSRDHLLEIGCGWGGFAVHAAREAGCRVTGVTLSERQAECARDRVAAAGLEGRVDIRLQDYRHVEGDYDGVASIEMFEAVGERWWPVFFGRLHELLRPAKAAALQVITIEERRFEDYRRRPDFIQRYIFPGGMLPSPERFATAAYAAGLDVGEPRFFGPDYARTLHAWSDRFESALPKVRDLGFDDRFIRMWRYYLAYCITGFNHGAIDVMQVRLAR